MHNQDESKNIYEGALGVHHHENRIAPEPDSRLTWRFYVPLLIALSMMIYGAIEFFLQVKP